jgi:hypothetical protein
MTKKTKTYTPVYLMSEEEDIDTAPYYFPEGEDGVL